jgi:hypothetical protein
LFSHFRVKNPSPIQKYCFRYFQHIYAWAALFYHGFLWSKGQSLWNLNLTPPSLHNHLDLLRNHPQKVSHPFHYRAHHPPSKPYPQSWTHLQLIDFVGLPLYH